jgi:hypothetical protein
VMTMKSRLTATSFQGLAKQKAAIPLIISRIPIDLRHSQKPEDAPRLKAKVELEFWNTLEESLSPKERELLQESLKKYEEGTLPPTDCFPPSILAKIDANIFRQAEAALCWRIMEIEIVQQRFHDWELDAENGPDRFIKLGEAMGSSVNILHRQMPAPLDRNAKQFKKEMVKELRTILRALRVNTSLVGGPTPRTRYSKGSYRRPRKRSHRLSKI